MTGYINERKYERAVKELKNAAVMKNEVYVEDDAKIREAYIRLGGLYIEPSSIPEVVEETKTEEAVATPAPKRGRPAKVVVAE